MFGGELFIKIKVFIFVVFFENMGAFLDLTGTVRHGVHVVRGYLSL